MFYFYLITFFTQVREKMYADIVAIVREMKKHEAQSKIKAREEKYQRQYAMRAFKAHKKQIIKNNFNKRTRQK